MAEGGVLWMLGCKLELGRVKRVIKNLKVNLGECSI